MTLRRARLVLVLATIASACHPAAVPPRVTTPAVVDLGPLSMPPVVTGRDGGAAGLVGGRMLWVFQDTLMSVEGADGNRYRTSTAALGRGASLALEEPLDRAGAPFELLPYTPDEWTYNRAHGPSERYALWPGSVVPWPDGTALVVYSELKVHPRALDYEGIGVGLAHVRPGETTASRDPELLFHAPDRAWALGGLVDGGLLYLYAVDPVPGQLDTETRVVRAPLEHVAERSAWRAWDGAGWSPDLSRAAPVFHGAGGDASVSRNAHVGGWLAVYGGIFSNDVHYRTAPRPEGPWSDERLLFTAMGPPPPGKASCYAAKEHPELSTEGGRTIVVSYARPLGELRGEVRLASVKLP